MDQGAIWRDSEPTARQPRRIHARSGAGLGRAEQQRPGIRGDLTTSERSHHLAAFDHFITEQVAVYTLSASGISSAPA